MQAELTAYQDSISAVGKAVAVMNDCRVKLHAAIEAAAGTVSAQVAIDVAAVPIKS